SGATTGKVSAPADRKATQHGREARLRARPSRRCGPPRCGASAAHLGSPAILKRQTSTGTQPLSEDVPTQSEALVANGSFLVADDDAHLAAALAAEGAGVGKSGKAWFLSSGHVRQVFDARITNEEARAGDELLRFRWCLAAEAAVAADPTWRLLPLQAQPIAQTHASSSRLAKDDVRSIKLARGSRTGIARARPS